MSSAGKTCFLHIGAPKTGSTALQEFLSTNRDVLARSGFHYPAVSLRGFGHHDLAFLAGGGYPAWATPQERPLDSLIEELKLATADSVCVILSSENFYLLSKPGDVAQMLERAGIPQGAVRVVVYARRQDETHVSWYNQAVKAQGYTGTIADSVREMQELWDYAAQLSKWEAVFGRDRLTVRPYQRRDLTGGDIRRDFVRLVGLPEEGFQYTDHRVNSRINRDILEFQRLVNRLPLSAQQRRRFHRELMALTSATADSDLFNDAPLLGARQRRELLSRYAESNAAVAQRYLDRTHLFDEILGPESSEPAPEEGLTSEKLAYILGWILARESET